MNHSVKLLYQNGFSWFQDDTIAFKGFFFDQSRKLYQDRQALEIINLWLSEKEDIIEKCTPLDGIYSIIIKGESSYTIFVDRINFFPLFFCYHNNQWNISDSWNELYIYSGNNTPNTDAFAEFLSAGYVLNDQTLSSNIFKTCSGEKSFLLQDGSYNKMTWYSFLTPSFFDAPFNKLSEALHQVLISSTEKLKTFLNGRTAIVPLSGGYDSRLVACLLKTIGYTNTICITYGRMNPEAEISRGVAEALGFKWIFTDYEQISTDRFLDDTQFEGYVEYAGNGFSMPYLQEYFSVKYLKENRLIPDNSVFLPGHPGDYLAGSYIDNITQTPVKSNSLSEVICRHYFNFIDLTNSQKTHITQRVRQHLKVPNTHYDGHPAFSTLMEDWDMKEKRSKFIFHSSSVFNYFGFPVYFPLWNKELVDYFRMVPFEYRSQKKLYDFTLENNFFKPMGVFYNKREINPTAYDRWLFPIKKKIKAYLPLVYKRRLLQQKDYICYGRFTESMQAESKKKGLPELKHFNAYNALICRWYLFRLFTRNFTDYLRRQQE